MSDMILPVTLVAAFALVVIAMVNTLIRRKNEVAFAFSSIDAQLKKRYDLIPNLVAVAERYMGYEQGVLADITALRAKAAAGNLDIGEQVDIDNAMGKTLRTLFAVAENYPALQASGPFLHLQASLNEVEEQLAASRRAFNAAVTAYNNGCEMFPLNIIAGFMGYKQKPWFVIPEEERQPVRVWR
ncbi:LemA family protein [Geomonas subterranea]|uniref:LemA family protein n=1 Tax=Geomonas subterranea TaxID=2847989 RepID=UPI001CD5A225|nr:LemA family protein [Geomonas fuzhouensis]